jgi:hypothetical protein
MPEYYKTNKGYCYKKTIETGSIRISINDYEKIMMKKGGIISNQTNNQIDKKMDGFYNSKLKLCYNNKETLGENRKSIYKDFTNVINSIDEYYSQYSLDGKDKAWMLYGRERRKKGNYPDEFKGTSHIIEKPDEPEKPIEPKKNNSDYSKKMKIYERKMERYKSYIENYNKFNLTSYDKIQNTFPGMTIEFHSWGKVNNNNNIIKNKLKYSIIVRHPTGLIMNILDFVYLLKNNFKNVSDSAEYVILNKDGLKIYSSNYPFAGMTHYKIKNDFKPYSSNNNTNSNVSSSRYSYIKKYNSNDNGIEEYNYITIFGSNYKKYIKGLNNVKHTRLPNEIKDKIASKAVKNNIKNIKNM